MEIAIYQVNLDKDKKGVAFFNLDYIGGENNVDPTIYTRVWDGNVKANNLEDVYRIFNIDHPQDFNARSMSVSDVVEIIGDGFYYCDNIGFKKLDDFSADLCDDYCEDYLPPIKVIVCEPNKPAYVSAIDANLENYQNIVSGMIECYYPFKDEVCIVCNDEGKFNGSMPNRAIYDENGEMLDIIFGTFFICDCSGENFGSLTPDMESKYLKMFKRAERFYRKNGKIVAEKI